MNTLQIALTVVVLAIAAAASYGMWIFFGFVGVGLFIGMTAGVVGIITGVSRLQGGGESAGGRRSSRRQSKGARRD